MTYSKPEKITKKFTRIILKNAAHYKMVDTGKKEVITVIDKDGNRVEQEIPIKKKIFIEAEKETLEVDKEFWAVKDGDEVHEFSNEDDALQFIAESRKEY